MESWLLWPHQLGVEVQKQLKENFNVLKSQPWELT